MSVHAPSELEVYLEVPVDGRQVYISTTSESLMVLIANPIDWWFTYFSKFPHLSAKAWNFLVVSAPSVRSG